MSDTFGSLSDPSQEAGSPSEATDVNPQALLAHLRHELRTPINAIMGYSEMLLEDTPEKTGMHQDLERIRAAGLQLLSHVNDLLSPSTLRSWNVDTYLRCYAAVLCYELRTGINTVMGYSELLMEEAPTLGKEGLTPDLVRIRAAAQRLCVLVEDIGDYGKILQTFDKNPETHATVKTMMERVQGSDNEAVPPMRGGHLLIVDDDPTNRDVLSRRLARQGHTSRGAANGEEALAMLRDERFDLILLDIMMAGMNGFQTLSHLKKNPLLHDIPVIMISAMEEIDKVACCIEMGAEDYLYKPFNTVLLNARVMSCLKKKRFHDQEVLYLNQIKTEQEKSERLLLNILPKTIVGRLKEDKEVNESYEAVTVLFADLVGFGPLSERITAGALVHLLNQIFSLFDELTLVYGLEKIKTIGDAYMVVSGLPVPRGDHAVVMAEMALAMQNAMKKFNQVQEKGMQLALRIGMHSGPVVAGIIGTRKFSYDLWGDTVNTASRMESHGLSGKIHLAESTYHLLESRYLFEKRGWITVKGKGKVMTYFLKDKMNVPPARGAPPKR
jgi:class 3 adenylate cyclase/ActR/RegA family two-component response regulator